MDQADIDSGEVINTASVECTDPQELAVAAMATSKVLLSRTYGIVIGELGMLAVGVMSYCTYGLERDPGGILARTPLNLLVNGASTPV